MSSQNYTLIFQFFKALSSFFEFFKYKVDVEFSKYLAVSKLKLAFLKQILSFEFNSNSGGVDFLRAAIKDFIFSIEDFNVSTLFSEKYLCEETDFFKVKLNAFKVKLNAFNKSSHSFSSIEKLDNKKIFFKDVTVNLDKINEKSLNNSFNFRSTKKGMVLFKEDFLNLENLKNPRPSKFFAIKPENSFISSLFLFKSINSERSFIYKNYIFDDVLESRSVILDNFLENSIVFFKDSLKESLKKSLNN